MILLIVWLVFCSFVLWYVFASLTSIPENHVGVPSIFGDRFYFGRKQITIMPEGLRWRPLPAPLTKVAVFSLTRDIDPFIVTAFTRYGKTIRNKSDEGETAKVIFDLTMEWQPHQRPDLFRRFIELSSAAASHGDTSKMDPAIKSVQDSLKDILGKLCSEIDPGDVIDLRKDFADLLNVYARGNREQWMEVENFFSLKDAEQQTMRARIKKILKEIDECDLTLDKDDSTISPTEERLGIRIFRINVTNVAFAPETEQAIQSKIRKAGEAKGAEVQWNKKRDLAKEMQDMDVPPTDSFKEASVTLGESSRIIVDSPGGGPVIPIIQFATPSGTRPPRGGGKPKGKKEE